MNTESTMAKLWENEPARHADTTGEAGGSEHPPESEQETHQPENGNVASSPEALVSEGAASEAEIDPTAPPQMEDASVPGVAGKKYLLIETNEESIRKELVSEAKNASQFARRVTFERPRALREGSHLRPHQEHGVRWLQTCSQIHERTGVLLADDMGVGKTVQILTFLAWCIESGKFPGLSKSEPPFQPILIVAPLILVDTRTWEKEMEKFFTNDGVIFWPVLSLHGDQLAKLRRDDAAGRETEIGKPILDLNRIRRHKVVITNYETIKSYQHSFAFVKDGAPLWSFIISDEAQEFKVPSTKISHAMKALKAQMHIACTGTPVENRLLDLWNICDALQPGLLSSAREFVAKFENNQTGSNQENSLMELKKTLLFQQPHAFLLRRTKSDVAELPPKSVFKLDCDMSNAEIEGHRSLLSKLRTDGRQSRFLSALQGFVQLYQHLALLTENAEDLSAGELVSQSSKLRVLIAKLHEIRGKKEKVIIFARLRTMQGILAKVLQAEFQLPVRIINGETKLRGSSSLNKSGVKTRNAILNDFQNTLGFNILILSPFVAGIGLTIVEANHVVHYGRWWNPAVESQATDRAYRIGQTKEVSVYLPILRDPSRRVAPTFDERLDLLMDNKQRLAEDFLRPLAPEDEMRDELFEDLSAEAARQS
jgi:SNF2 family DNA or RNA helicase